MARWAALLLAILLFALILLSAHSFTAYQEAYPGSSEGVLAWYLFDHRVLAVCCYRDTDFVPATPADARVHWFLTLFE